MIRTPLVEMEATKIAEEIWPRLFTAKDMPKIESKHGGSSAAYYQREHCVRVRSNVWAKLLPAQKRLIMIHELYHASGHDHASYFLSSHDYISREIYKKIWGYDKQLDVMLDGLINEATK